MENKEYIKNTLSFDSTISIVTGRMLSALTAYYIWKWLNHSININNAGGEEKANRNVDILNKYNMFFNQVIRSTYKSFVADLWIFFDHNKYEESFSISKLIDSTKDKLSKEDINDLKSQINIIKKNHGKNIGFLGELRNADVAHQELDSKKRHLLYENIESLFAGAQEILNLITKRYNNSEHWWTHVEKEVKEEMPWILDNLERGEKLRIEEILINHNE